MPPFPLVAQPKRPRGSDVLDREVATAQALALERRVKAAVRKRDGRCRWPEAHRCRGALECAHVLDKSLGGVDSEFNEILLCAWIHRRGPDSIHGKQLKVTRETPEDAAVPLFAFWRQGEDGIYFLVAREVAPFQFERD